MRKALTALAVIFLLLLVAGAWLLADLNRFRLQAEAALSARAGSEVRIAGDLGWQLLPTPALTAASIAAVDGAWRVAQASVRWPSRRIALDGIELGAAAFADLGVKDLSAKVVAGDGDLRIDLRAAEILGGSGRAAIGLPADSQPGPWTLDLQTDGLRAAALEPWLDPQLRWEGALRFGCQLRLAEGPEPLAAAANGWAALAADLRGECRLTGGQGRIQAPGLNKLLAAAARLAGDFRETAASALNYRQLRGVWTLAGSKHSLQANLDNLAVTGQGEYNYLEDNLDFLAQLTLENPAASAPLDASPRGLLAVSPALVGLPIPVRCRGAIRTLRCGLDMGAFAAQLAALARAGEGSPQARQLEAVIEGAVPQKYRKAAASLLKLLAEGQAENE